MMDDRKAHHRHSLPLQELAGEKLDPRYGLNLWQYNHKGHIWHRDLHKGISSLGQHSLPLSLEVEQSQEWSHQISALQTSPGGKSSVSQRGLTPCPQPSLKWVTQITLVRLFVNRQQEGVFLFFVFSCREATSIFWQPKRQSSWQWPWNAVQCWSTVFFQVTSCDINKKESGEGKWLWFYFLLKLSNFFFLSVCTRHVDITPKWLEQIAKMGW